MSNTERSGYIPEVGVWTAADTRRYLAGFDPSVAAKFNSTVAALIRALEDSTAMLEMSQGIAEDGQAIRNRALLAELKK